MDAALYVRQSLAHEGEGADESLSLASQERAMRSFCDAQGWRVAGVFRDHDVRGKTPAAERPGLSALLAAAERGEFSAVVVFEMSRLARKVRVQEEVIDRLEAAGSTLHSVREPWVGNPMFRQILGAVAEDMSRLLAHHVRSAMMTRIADRGAWNGPVPLGYEMGPDGRLALGPEPERQTALTIFRRYAAGDPVNTVCRDLTAAGVPTRRGNAIWKPSSIHTMLRNPGYRGISRAAEVEHHDAHPTFIPADVIAAVDARLIRAGIGQRGPREKQPARRSWLEGLVRHDCGRGAHITGRTEHPNFRCNAYHKGCEALPAMISRAKLERAARALVAQAVASVPSLDDANARARAEWEAAVDAAGGGGERRAAEAKIAAAQSRLERLARLMLDRDMPEGWYERERRRILDERDAARAVLDAMPPAPDPAAIAAAHALLSGVRGADLVWHMEGSDLRALLSEIGVIVYGASGVSLDPAPSFAALITSRSAAA